MVNAELNEDNVSWRAGINWQANSTSLLYANVSRGYKNGAFPAAGATSSAAYTNPATQETVLAFETGFKLGLLNRSLQLNGAAFLYKYDDKQLRGKIRDQIGFLNALINIPKSDIRGVELQAIWEPVRKLVLTAGGTYIRSKIKSSFVNFDAIGVSQSFQGESLPLTPKWQLMADAQYTVPLGGVEAFAGVNVNYQGSTNAGLGEVPMFDLPSYTLVDLRAGVQTPDSRWRLQAYARNVTNKFYLTLVNQPGPDTIVRYAGQPRSYGLTLSYRY